MIKLNEIKKSLKFSSSEMIPFIKEQFDNSKESFKKLEETMSLLAFNDPTNST